MCGVPGVMAATMVGRSSCNNAFSVTFRWRDCSELVTRQGGGNRSSLAQNLAACSVPNEPQRFLRADAIAEAAHRHDDVRSLAELLPQAADVRVDRACIDRRLVAPHFVQKAFT